MIATSDPAVVAGVAGAPIVLVGFLQWLSARKTRRMNTEEHAITAGALSDIHSDVRSTNEMLVRHIADRDAHGLHVTTVVNPPPSA